MYMHVMRPECAAGVCVWCGQNIPPHLRVVRHQKFGSEERGLSGSCLKVAE